MFVSIFYYIYLAVAFFYLICGVVLLLRPTLIQRQIKPFFPLLDSFGYGVTVNSINLVLIGLGLLLISKHLLATHFLAFFTAIILSTLEVYLGFKFYYHEQRDLTQAVLHIVLHAGLVIIIILFTIDAFPVEIHTYTQQAASLILNNAP